MRRPATGPWIAVAAALILISPMTGQAALETVVVEIDSQPLAARFVVESALNDGGSFDLRLRNEGNLDQLPPTVDLPADCRLGDALGRYRLLATAEGTLQLVPEADAWLEAGAVMPIGWTRCNQSLQQEWELR